MALLNFRCDLFYLYRVKREELTEAQRQILGKHDDEVMSDLSPRVITEYQHDVIDCWGHNGKPLLLPVGALDLLSCEAQQQ